MELKNFFDQMTKLPGEEFEEFVTRIREVRYAKGSLFTRIGDRSDKIGFVKTGLFKVYYVTSEGRSVIRNFCYEGKPLGSYGTILTARPAHVNIEAIEDSVVMETSYSHLTAFYAKGAPWEKLGRRIAESHYISREQREFELLSLRAQDRYESFRKHFPGLEARVTQADVASYIGVDPATLSRLRRSKKNKQIHSVENY